MWRWEIKNKVKAVQKVYSFFYPIMLNIKKEWNIVNKT